MCIPCGRMYMLDRATWFRLTRMWQGLCIRASMRRLVLFITATGIRGTMFRGGTTTIATAVGVGNARTQIGRKGLPSARGRHGSPEYRNLNKELEKKERVEL